MNEPPGTTNVSYFLPRVYFLSADHTQAGAPEPFQVKALAFGAIPITATVSISQLLDQNGEVIPIQASQGFVVSSVGNIARDATARGQVSVRLSNLVVDGTPVNLGGACQTVAPGDLDLKGKGFLLSGEQPPGTYSGALGGVLSGVLNLPAFGGCTDGAEDYSPLLTNAVSGVGNPVTINQASPNSACYPLPPTRQNASVCQGSLADIELPQNLPEVEPGS